MTTVNVTDFFAGDSYVHDFTVRDEKAKLVDLTGASARWALMPAIGSRITGEPVYIADASPEITFPAAGKVRVSIERDVLTGAGEYRHELELTLATGQSQTIAYGRFTILAAGLVSMMP